MSSVLSDVDDPDSGPASAWQSTLLALPALRLRLALNVDHDVLPYPDVIRGAIGQQLLRTAQEATLRCLFPSGAGEPALEPRVGARDGVRFDMAATSEGAVAISPWGVTSPWALRVDVATRHLEIGVFANALEHLPQLLSALLSAARGRIGGCHNLALGAITHETGIGTNVWMPGLPATATAWALPPRPRGAVDVHLLTPLRLRRGGREVRSAEFTPRDLLSNLMRKFSALTAQAGLPPLRWEPAALLAALADVRWIEPRLHWKIQDRYSQRQGARMSLGGLLGVVGAAPDALGALWPVLWMGQFVHAGKTPSMGMGCYRLRARPDALQADP
jgi:hypothetical protein